jgi:acyl-CoA thioesterase I
LLAWALSTAAAAHAERTVLVFGDSLSAAYGLNPNQGWVHLFAERARQEKPGWRVVNASVSGETTAGGLRRLPEDLKRHKPQLVIIALGANDGLRGQPVAGMRANLEQMVALVRQAGAEPVLVGMMIPPNYGIEYAAQFARAFEQVATARKVARVPFLLDGVADKPDLFQADQLHPTAAAQARILENVMTAVAPLLRKRPS